MITLFALRGLHHGIVRQIFDLLGWLGGIASCLWVSQWVGAHWQGARPAVVFWALGWLVAVLAGLAVKAVFQLWGERIGKGAENTRGGLPDRLGGFALGAGIGVVLVSALLIGLTLATWPRALPRIAADSRLAALAFAGARRVAAVDERWIPGTGTLRRALDEAERRARQHSRRS